MRDLASFSFGDLNAGVIEQETDLPVHLVDAPLECVVLGAGR